MSNLDVPDDMLFYAFRYALGRSSYAVSQVTDQLVRHAGAFDANDRCVMVREIREALGRDGVGMECDRVQWLRVLGALESTNTAS